MPDTDPAVQPVLEARAVSKSFPGVKALDDVGISVLPGRAHALIGENGAGKSTLIKILTGVYQLDSGTLLHRGREVSFADPHASQAAGISTIYQELDLVPLQSASRNLYLGREPRTRLRLVDFRRMRRDAIALLTEYGIDADVDVPIAALGLGTQQMISVARSVAMDANVVIMDEPTSSLEPREVETLFRIIDRLKAAGVAIIYVSHRLDELYRVCEDVTVLRDGKLVHTGLLADLPRLKLVATMLGRELMEQSRRERSEGEGPDPDAEPVLSVQGVSRRNLLHDVSFDVRPGEILGLGGLLGAGRSETGMAVLGAQEIDSGRVLVNGVPVRRNNPGAAIEAGIAMLPEDRKLAGILPTLSIRDNIALAALPRLSRAGLVSEKKIDAIVTTFMAQLSIRATGPQQKVGTLSGGNQQKVMLARWLCLNPKVLILDEPTRGIDVGAKAEVRATIDDLAAQGLAVVLVSSEAEELVEESDRIVVLREGRVVDELEGDRMSEHALMEAIASAGEAAAQEAAAQEAATGQAASDDAPSEADHDEPGAAPGAGKGENDV